MSQKQQEFLKRVQSINRAWEKGNKSTDTQPARLRIASDVKPLEIVSTGNPALDWGLGGGIPETQIVEIFGAAGSGKTSCSSYIITEFQKKHPEKFVVWYSTEETGKPAHSWKLAGANEDYIIFIDARKSGEDGFNVIKDMLLDENKNPIGMVSLIVIDSISFLAPEGEVNSADEDLANVSMAQLSRLTSKLLRLLCGEGWLRGGTTLICINQERQQIGNTPMANVSSGGMAMKYGPKIKIKLNNPKAGYITNDKKEIIGHTVEYSIPKNNTGSAPPFRSGRWRVIYGQGIDYIGPIIEEAFSYGIIKAMSARSYQVRWWDKDNNLQTSKTIVGTSAVKFFVENDKEIQEGLQKLNSISRKLTEDCTIIEGIVYKNAEPIDIIELISTKEESESIEITEEEVILEED